MSTARILSELLMGHVGSGGFFLRGGVTWMRHLAAHPLIPAFRWDERI
jgi:hypothetical protein